MSEQARSAKPCSDPIRTVAVIGAGDRGRAFALRCAAAGCRVVLQDVLSSRLRKAEEQIVAAAPDLRQQLMLAESIEDAVREADLAIDFVPDELESKLEIFSLLDRMAPPKTVFCTPTALSISDLASCTYRAECCVAVAGETTERGSSISVMLGRKTDEEVAERVGEWLGRVGFRVSLATEEVIPH